MTTEINSKYDIQPTRVPDTFNLPEVDPATLTPEQSQLRDKVNEAKTIWKDADEFVRVVSNPSKYMSKEPQNGLNYEYHQPSTFAAKKEKLMSDLTKMVEYFQNLERSNDAAPQFPYEQRMQVKEVAITMNMKRQELSPIEQPGTKTTEKLSTSVTPDFMSQVRKLFSFNRNKG